MFRWVSLVKVKQNQVRSWRVGIKRNKIMNLLQSVMSKLSRSHLRRVVAVLILMHVYVQCTPFKKGDATSLKKCPYEEVKKYAARARKIAIDLQIQADHIPDIHTYRGQERLKKMYEAKEKATKDAYQAALLAKQLFEKWQKREEGSSCLIAYAAIAKASEADAASSQAAAACARVSEYIYNKQALEEKIKAEDPAYTAAYEKVKQKGKAARKKYKELLQCESDLSFAVHATDKAAKATYKAAEKVCDMAASQAKSDEIPPRVLKAFNEAVKQAEIAADKAAFAEKATQRAGEIVKEMRLLVASN
jgi:hypothetical protein